MKLDDNNKALICFAQAILHGFEDPAVYHYKGLALEHIGKYQKALDSFKEVKELDPSYHNIDEKIREIKAKIDDSNCNLETNNAPVQSQPPGIKH